jgi:hypothetical protein
MKRIFVVLLFSVFFIALQPSSKAQDTLVPAGTLIRCTLDEPNFSSATVSPGDPVVCHLSSLQIYGRNVFPRGSYLGGHLEAAKDPGHFVGKGYLQLQFDRIGFPSTDIPVPSKVIAAKGFKVDKQGDIVGRGHATRDIVEWMIPPLWPWKILTLPARGPRPTLKGEEQITLRLMDDIVVPRVVASAERPPAFYHPQPSYDRPANYRPRVYERPAATNVPVQSRAPSDQAVANNVAVDMPAAMPIVATPAALTVSSVVSAPEPTVTVNQDAQRLTLIALKTGTLLVAATYHIDNDIVNYTTVGGTQNSVDAHDVDWRRTTQLNIRHPETNVATPLPHAY